MTTSTLPPDTTAATLRLTVVRRRQLTRDVVEFTLAGEGDLPTWTPGAHLDVWCGDLVRQYSLCGDHRDRIHYRIAVLRDPAGRGGSTLLHDRVAQGDLVKVSAPRNAFPLEPSLSYIFIAGGIGITPILPMIEEAETRRADWILHYGGRSRTSMAYADELAQYGDRVRLHPQDEVGHLPLRAILGTPQVGSIYCCGPSPLLAAVTEAAQSWSAGSLHVEHFAPVALDTAAERSFEVQLARSGTVHQVPADRTLLEVLIEAGVALESSCEVGTCGTCEIAVLQGEPDHRDSVLTADERRACRYMMPCVSRSKSSQLVLDL